MQQRAVGRRPGGETGAHLASPWLAGRRRAAMGARVAPGQGESGGCENSGKNPTQPPAAHEPADGLRQGGKAGTHRGSAWRARRQRAAAGGADASGPGGGGRCENSGSNPIRRPAAREPGDGLRPGGKAGTHRVSAW